MANLAQFTINGTPAIDPVSGDRFFLATNSQVLTIALEVTAGVLSYRVQVFDPTDSESPLASLSAPNLTWIESGDPDATGAATDTFTITMPGAGAHSYLIRVTATTPDGPDVFERLVYIETTNTSLRKTVPAESQEARARAWSDDINLMVEAIEAGAGGGGGVTSVTSGDPNTLTVAPNIGAVVATPNNQRIDVTGGDYNTAFGAYALVNATPASGQYNTAFGYAALTSLTTADRCTAFGVGAGGANVSTSDLTALGYAAAASTTASNVTAIGSRAMENAGPIAHYNIALGQNALRDVLGESNVAIGFQAGTNWTEAEGNVLIGDGVFPGIALPFASRPVGNVAIGENAMNSGTTADFNVFVGWEAGEAVTSGNQNTGVGLVALDNLVNGNNNVAVGSVTGGTLVSGSANILIGFGADVPAAATANHLNIGDTIFGETASTFVRLGGSGVVSGPERLRIEGDERLRNTPEVIQRWEMTTAGADEGFWETAVGGTSWRLRTVTDVLGPGADAITVNRSGTALGQINIGSQIFSDTSTSRVRIGGSGALGGPEGFRVLGRNMRLRNTPNVAFRMRMNTAAVDESIWETNVNATTYRLRTMTDGLGVGSDVFVVNRTGTTVNEIDLQDNDLIDSRTVTFEQEFDNGNAGAADTIDWGVAQKQRSTLTANTTYTFTAPKGPGNFLLRVIQDPTGGWAVTWPGTVRWPGGAAPAISSGAANSIHIVTFYYDGTNYYGVGNLSFA